MAAYSADNTTTDALITATLDDDTIDYRDLVSSGPAAQGLAEAARRLSAAYGHARDAAASIARDMQRVVDGGPASTLAGTSDFMRYEQAQGEITAAREALSGAAFVYRKS